MRKDYAQIAEDLYTFSYNINSLEDLESFTQQRYVLTYLHL